MAEIWQVMLPYLGDAIPKFVLHFMCSGFVGLLGLWWMQTTDLPFYSGGMWIAPYQKDVYCIPASLWLVLLSLAIWIHVLLDYTLNLF
jgi:hypothetical protein